MYRCSFDKNHKPVIRLYRVVKVNKKTLVLEDPDTGECTRRNRTARYPFAALTREQAVVHCMARTAAHLAQCEATVRNAKARYNSLGKMQAEVKGT